MHQLLTDVDDAGKLLVLLRDGRKLMGILRSFDQFGIQSSFHAPLYMILLIDRDLNHALFDVNTQPMRFLKALAKG